MVADVKMMNFFRYLGVTGATVVFLLVLASVFVQNAWCRYLCPYGALLGLIALAGPLRIRRNASLCIDCSRCAKACPAALPVNRLITIQSAECTGCMSCVAECPAAGALQMSAPGGRRVQAWVFAAGVAVLFLGICGWARWTGHWNTDVASQVYFEMIPRANEFTHP
jgi:polyferredoxin